MAVLISVIDRKIFAAIDVCDFKAPTKFTQLVTCKHLWIFIKVSATPLLCLKCLAFFVTHDYCLHGEK